LGRLVVELLPDPEAVGLFGSRLLHESRRAARTLPDGELVLLEDQDRSLWNQELIAEGSALVQRAFSSGRIGPYSLQGNRRRARRVGEYSGNRLGRDCWTL
jgi:RNA polymerase sigma-70 factor (ECF subfamily)